MCVLSAAGEMLLKLKSERGGKGHFHSHTTPRDKRTFYFPRYKGGGGGERKCTLVIYFWGGREELFFIIYCNVCLYNLLIPLTTSIYKLQQKRWKQFIILLYITKFLKCIKSIIVFNPARGLLYRISAERRSATAVIILL